MGLLRRCLTVLLLLTVRTAFGQAGRFDLPGPKIDIRITRAGVMLPIASVPNLQPGDQIWLHPDLPPTQSVHYLLIATFLRGTTNPPPDNWFIRIETWDKKVREEGVTVTVPDEAQQSILFLAPETGGDFGTLRSAVKGRPGIFVRASQDLTEAGFEQGRIQKYLDAMKQVPPGDSKALQEHSDLLARTLALKPNPDCFKRPLDQQYTCLTQTGTQTLLDDGHAQSIAAALSNGPGSDFINQASYTKLAGAGDYSAYVGAIVDLIRLTSGLHTAKYQYIPAIAFPPSDSSQTANPDASKSSLDLRLNTPPSFNNPKSVIVIGLPAVQKAVSPPLRPVDASHISCLLDPHLALPIEGAPLVFSTAFAHDLVLHLDAGNKDIPVTPDPYQGGLVLKPATTERHELPAVPAVPIPDLGMTKQAPPQPESKPTNPGAPITGTIQGFWGFDRFTGPTLALQTVPGTGWRILPQPGPAGTTPNTLIVGQPNHIQLLASGTACVRSIALEPTDTKIDWKLASVKHPDPSPAAAAPAPTQPPLVVPPVSPIDLTLKLASETAPGSIHLAIQQFGAPDPDMVGATAFVEPARIEAFQLHAGDTSAILTGASLDQVKSVTLKDAVYTPGESAKPEDGKTLCLSLPPDAKSPFVKPNEKLTAEVHLRDGRTLPVATSVLAARPAVSILSRRVTQPTASPIQLTHSPSGDPDLALGSQLTFFLKSKAPFLRTDQVEIANQAEPDPSATQPPESIHTTLSVASGGLVLQDAHTILATFDPLKTFGSSTFGPFRLRPIATDGTPGEWIPLATIVRLPTLTSLTCPLDPAAPCQLVGSALYLIDSVALDAAFTSPTRVPEGFVDTTLTIPHPTTQPAVIYLKLRDDPTAVQQATLAIQSDSPPPPRSRRSSGASASIPAPPLPTVPNAPAATTPSTVPPQP